MADMSQIGRSIRYYREKQGVSQKTLADRLFVSFQAISAWERGQSLPDLQNCMNLAEYFGIPVDALLSTAERALYVGIDGGGTKTEFILFDGNGHIVARHVESGSNPNDIGVDGCLQVLFRGLDQLLCGRSCRAIFGGIGGAGVGNHRQVLTQRMEERYHTRIAIDTDAANLLSCAADPEHSIAVICGTGSSVHIRKGSLRKRIGGWGYLFDQAGSAYDVGRDALRHAMAVEDGLDTEDTLYRSIRETVGAAMQAAIPTMYERGRAYIASFARHVTAAHAAGDATAGTILRRNAAYLATLIRTAILQCGMPPEITAAGGFIHENAFRAMVEEAAGVMLTLPELPPVFGACVEAMRLDDQEITDEWRKNFRTEYRRLTC